MNGSAISIQPAGPGHEIEKPMALVIVGGLTTSTIMNLFFLPALYRAFGRVGAENTIAETTAS